MKTVAVVLVIVMFHAAAAAAGPTAETYTLNDVIAYGLAHNARVRSAEADVAVERSGIQAAQADRMPRLDASGGVTKYQYPAPVTPITVRPSGAVLLPDFYQTLYDAGVSFTLPLYRGGRLDRAVTIAELRASAAEDLFRMSRQELVYNLTSTYYKILQLEMFVSANEETVKQLEAHKRNVELFLRAGTAARLELLKTETELAHAQQAALISSNNRESAYEVLKVLMGMEDLNKKITLVQEPGPVDGYPSREESMIAALARRPDYQAVMKKITVAEERVSVAQGRRYPSFNLTGTYVEQTGPDYEWKDNWFFGVRLTLPLFDGGSIASDVGKTKAELIKAREEERALRLDIGREVRDAYLNIENAAKRIEVAEKAIVSAKESARIEQVRFRAGAGTSTDVIDAQTALLRAETDYYQALYDKAIARASLRKAAGEDYFTQGDK